MLEIEIENESELEQLDGFEIENGMMTMTDYHNRMVTTRSFGTGKKVREGREMQRKILLFFFSHLNSMLTG